MKKLWLILTLLLAITAEADVTLSRAVPERRVSAYPSGAQVLTTGVVTPLLFDSELTDIGALHSTAANTDRFVAVDAGWYLIVAQATYALSGAGMRQIRINLNGTTDLALKEVVPTAGATQPADLILIVLLAAGDYVTLNAYQTSGGNLNTVAGRDRTYLQMTRLGRN
jgi:hypothetical protein